MFKPVNGGSFEEIKCGSIEGMDIIKCHIPPVGYIYDFTTCKRDPITGWIDLSTGKLVHIGVARRALATKDQFWERDKRWELYLTWKKDEDKIKNGKNSKFVHPDLAKFEKDCWMYRMGGFWFYNKGIPTYITGSYWFHLSCVVVTNGWAKYRDEDRKLHYQWNYALTDPESLGQILITKRRYGKCFGYGTKIRMYDGSVKEVQDVVEGDVVMGADSTPRVAYGITRGREPMYRVNYGENSFECNKSHIISLKHGITGDVKNIKLPKANLYKSAGYYLYKQSGELFDFTIEPIGEGDYYGFAVDKDHLFLLEDGLVVHNTTYAISLFLDMVTREGQFKVGIQSKDDEGAEEVYGKAVSAYKKLPYFFQPKFSNINQSTKELKFAAKKIEDIDSELESKVDYKASGLTQYDGERLGFYYGDEEGKTTSIDVNKRWGVVQFCLLDNDGKVVGKSLHTTTVEDMDGTAENFLKMWKDSDLSTWNEETKTTRSRLYKYFVSAVRAREINKYGLADEELALKKIMARRKLYADDPRELSEYIRKEPITEEEAFQVDAKDCPFNPVIINEQLGVVTFADYNLYETGNFKWEGEPYKSPVKFEKSPNGRWMIVEHPPEEIRNRYTTVGGHWFPANTSVYAGGADPYDHRFIDIGEGKRKLSDGAGAIIKKPDSNFKSEMDGGIVAFYRCRVSNPKVYYDDMLMGAIYFGTEMLIEVNKPGCVKHFEDNNFHHYAAKLKGSNDRGFSTGESTNRLIFELTDVYINLFVHLCRIKTVLEDWLKFDATKTTKFDAAMAVGMALILMDDRGLKKKEQKEPLEITKLIPYFTIQNHY